MYQVAATNPTVSYSAPAMIAEPAAMRKLAKAAMPRPVVATSRPQVIVDGRGQNGLIGVEKKSQEGDGQGQREAGLENRQAQGNDA